MSNVDMNAAVEHYIALRDQKDKINAEFKAKLAEIDAQLKNGQAFFLHHLNTTGQTGGKFPAGTLVIKTKTQTALKDREAFTQFVRSTGQLELMQMRVSSTAVAEYMENNDNQLPPGVEVTQSRDVEIRRARS